MLNHKKLLYTSLAIMAVAVFALGQLNTNAAGVMTGGNYVMELDSINDGGVDSGGGGYDLEDTIGEIGTGYSDDDLGDPNSGSPTYSMDVAGFQQVLGAGYITMTPWGDVALGDIPGMTGGTSDAETINGSVTTADTSGHTVMIQSATAGDAMVCDTTVTPDCAGAFFDDYPTVVTYPWNTSGSQFGFAVRADSDIVQAFLNASSLCNQPGGASSNANCWSGLNGTTPVTVIDTNVEGTTDNIRFRFKSEVENFQLEGAYKATIIITAVTK